MANNLLIMKLLLIGLTLFACNAQPGADIRQAMSADKTVSTATDTIIPPQYDPTGKLIRVTKSSSEWKKQLSTQAYYVLREKGTERAFTGNLWDNHEKGLYICAACGLPLFSSDTKFESGTGWPSFFKPLTADCTHDIQDNSYGMTRTEVECARCGGHLGHVFDDGPQPTGLRYCMNSVSLTFVKR
jgi:peptide-methionine (R)-S-oxide reductase